MKQLALLMMVLLAGNAYAQHEKEAGISSEKNADTLSLLQAFKKGITTGHFRYFFMSTDNQKELTDYYANAIGGGVKFETALFRKFQFGVSGFFIYNLKSSNLAEKDPSTHQYNRYELGLFDIENPENKKDIDRLEELYIKYTGSKVNLTFGKQLINTPFINPQDSRMRPTEVKGFYGKLRGSNKWHFEGGWLYNISPRSTVKWYSIAQSIGINSQGVTPDGEPGNYKGHLSSKGIGLTGLTYKPWDQIVIKVYNQYADNLFNTALLQAEYKQKAGNRRLKAAFQYVRQDVIKNGGNEDPTKTYFDKRNQVNVFGAKLGLEKKHWATSMNYTRITRSGRFTMPREWGTEPFFTYLSRERAEGAGDVNAIMANFKAGLPQYQLRFELGYGYYYLSDIENAALNKYKLPSYRHIKTWADYEFKGTLEGLDIAMLWIYKGQLQKELLDQKYLFNKVDMSSFNIIMNYRF